MSRTKKIRKQIEGLEEQIRLHQEKIEAELMKPVPNARRIRKWEKDIEVFRREIEKLERKLAKGRRRGSHGQAESD